MLRARNGGVWRRDSRGQDGRVHVLAHADAGKGARGRLARAHGEHGVAFANYERLLRPAIENKQRAARKCAEAFTPTTQAGIFLRNQATRLMRIPFVADLAMGNMFRDSLALPEYETVPPSSMQD